MDSLVEDDKRRYDAFLADFLPGVEHQLARFGTGGPCVRRLVDLSGDLYYEEAPENILTTDIERAEKFLQKAMERVRKLSQLSSDAIESVDENTPDPISSEFWDKVRLNKGPVREALQQALAALLILAHNVDQASRYRHLWK